MSQIDLYGILDKGESESGAEPIFICTNPQTLTDEQKEQARANIGAVAFESIVTAPIEGKPNLYDGSLELIEGYTRSNTAIDLANPHVVLDNPNSLYWMYPELIELKQGTTYAFTDGHFFEGAIYKKLTGTRSGYVNYSNQSSTFTKGDNFLLYTTPTTDSDFWLVIAFHKEYKDVADFQIVEGNSLPDKTVDDGTYLNKGIKVRASQVVGINKETEAAIEEVRTLVEKPSTETGSAVLFTKQTLNKDQQAQARTNIGVTVGYVGGSTEEEKAVNLVGKAGWTAGYGQLAGPVDLNTLAVPFDTALLKTNMHHTYNKLIYLKPNTTYAFSTGYTILSAIFTAESGGRSGYVTSAQFTAGNGCLLYTTGGVSYGYYFALSIHRGNYENLDAFAIYEGTEIPTEEDESGGDSLPEGEYLADGILVKAEQVVGLNQSAEAAPTPTSANSALAVDNFKNLHPIARKIQNVQSPTTLTMSFMSDTHYHDDALTAESSLSTARLMGLLGDFVRVDFIGNLGDMVPGNEEAEKTRNAMAKLVVSTNQNAKCPVIYARGNHDDNGWYSNDGNGGTSKKNEIINDKEWYQAVFGIKTKDLVIDPNRPCGGYGYLDDEKSKIRVFVLNSEDLPYILESNGTYRYNAYNGHNFSNAQLNFVANSLLFEDKEKPNEWAALFLSHVPLDTTNKDGYRFGIRDALIRGHDCLLAIIAAFRKGTSFSYSGSTFNASLGDKQADFNVSIDIDYSSKGVGDVIAFISGHTHTDNFSRRVGIENSLSRNYAFIGLMGCVDFANFVIDRENSRICAVKYGNSTPDNTAGAVVDSPDTGTIESGEWSVTFSQFRPNGENLYNGLSSVHASGYYPDNSSKVNLNTLELDSAPQTGSYITSKAVAVKPFTKYAIPSGWNGVIRAFGEEGNGSSWVTPVAENGYKVITTGRSHCYLVFSHHYGSYADYANFKIKEIYSGIEF
jgi:hypothetical protein